jgi:hypothetical protein
MNKCPHRPNPLQTVAAVVASVVVPASSLAFFYPRRSRLSRRSKQASADRQFRAFAKPGGNAGRLDPKSRSGSWPCKSEIPSRCPNRSQSRTWLAIVPWRAEPVCVAVTSVSLGQRLRSDHLAGPKAAGHASRRRKQNTMRSAHSLCDIAEEEPKLVTLSRSTDRNQPTIRAGRNE